MQRTKVIASTLLALMLAGCDQPTTTTDPVLPATILNSELQERIVAEDAPFILDVRSADEYAGGHIAGAVNIPHTDVATRTNELPTDKNTEIIVHCRSGRRATVAEATLAELGFTNVRHLEGDYMGWEAASLPLE
jgi:rhodanese-related sulfurtransferase